jgi:hypothetical protein
MRKLTKRTVDALKPYPSRDLVAFDPELSALGSGPSSKACLVRATTCRSGS